MDERDASTMPGMREALATIAAAARAAMVVLNDLSKVELYIASGMLE
ncbi:hypothetical protein AB0J63_46900 [Streptosporangium canum]